MNAYDLIENAIRNKLQVVATYQGQRRELCPHVLGWKNGKQHALFFQFKGGSSSQLAVNGGWRCLPLDGLNNVTTRRGTWHSGDWKAETQSCIDQIDLEVAAPTE